MNIEPITLAISGLVTATVPAIGALVYARNQWQASNRSDGDQERQERLDHQSCLEKLSEHIDSSAAKFADYDRRLDEANAHHRACQDNLASMQREIRQIRKTLSPPPFPKVKA